MTAPSSSPTGAAVHAHLRLSAPRAATSSCRTTSSIEADRLERRVDPAAHRHHHAHAREQGRRRDRPRRRRRRARRSRSPASSRSQIDAVIVATISNVAADARRCRRSLADRIGANPAAGLRHQRRLRRVHLRDRPGRRADPRRRRALRARGRRREALATSSTPTDRIDLVPARRRRRRRRHRPERRRPASRPTVWGSDGSKADAVGMNAHPRASSATGRRRGRRCARRARRSSAGRSGRWPRSPSRRWMPPGVTHRRPRRVRAPPGEHAHHRRVRQAAEAARVTS